ncbi:MAG: DinB family protein [Phycisphaeraceae bacterium]|nr:DinB family protein [Phycisphaeraceae bacterium]
MSKKAAARKPASKKAPSKKTTPKKSAPKKAARKSPARKPAKKAAPAKTAQRKSALKKAASRKATAARATPTTSRSIADQAIAFLRFAASTADAQIGSMPDEHALSQLHGADNHAAWTLGHQALSRAWFASSISGVMPPIPETYSSLFGGKSKPSADPGMYPSLDELRTNYRSSLDALIAAAESLTDADLGKPAHGDSGGWLTTRLDAVLKAAWHEGWHGGQIATLRRGLGLPPLM